MSVDEKLIAEYAARRQRSMHYFERASRVLGGKAGHDLRYFSPVPLYIERGEGSRKWDVDGNEYIDFLLGNGALLLGNAPPVVIEAITEVVARGTHFGSDHALQIEWAELVQQMVPAAERVRFVNSGSEATLLALRLARGFSGRNRFLRFEGHFHGWHDDVVHGFNPPFDADGSLGIPPGVRDHSVSIPDGDLQQVADILAHRDDLAAVILEATGASWGRVPLEVEFMQGLRELTRRHDVLLIFDEVISGFRFSPGGAQGLYGIEPDLSCFAKVVAGGTPGGAVAGRADIMELMDLSGDAHHDRFERVLHFGTFNAAPISAAAGVAVLKEIASGEPIERANAMAAKLRAAWEEVLERLGIAGYVYGACSTFHVFFETDEQRVRLAASREALHTTEAQRLKGMPSTLITEYQRQLRHYGVDLMSSTGGVLSAAHSDGDIEEATRAFEKTLGALCDLGLVLRLG